MARQRSNQDEDRQKAPGAPFWMTTYSDMVTLLLTFFVMLVTMSEIRKERFEKALSHFQGRPSVLQQESSIEMPTPPLPTDRQQSRRQNQNYERLLNYLEEKELTDKVQLNMRRDGLHLTITDSVMFTTGEAVLLPPARELLTVLSEVITDRVASAVVEGHTDNRPISTTRFASNWELSTARASSVARFLIRRDTPLSRSQFAIAGYGEHHPRSDNGTPAGQARNRRVEIFLRWKDVPLRDSSPLSLDVPSDLS